MPENSIDASVRFSFKGEYYHYATVIDLDQLLRQHDEMPSIHEILAKEHGVDTYSYLYEVMLEEEVEFSRPEGYAADYLIAGKFDQVAMATNWQNAKAGALLQAIAASELGILDLNQHLALKRALVEAYNLGRKA